MLILLSDYFGLRRLGGHDIYQRDKPHGLYWYRAGVDIRVLVAFLIDVVPQLPILVYQVNSPVKGMSRAFSDFTSLG